MTKVGGRVCDQGVLQPVDAAATFNIRGVALRGVHVVTRRV